MKNYLLSCLKGDYRLKIQNFTDDDETKEDEEGLDDKDKESHESEEITLSKRNLSMRLEKERARERKRVEKEYEEIIQKKIDEAIESYSVKQKEKEDEQSLSKLTEQERQTREFKKLQDELEQEKQKLANERKQIQIEKQENELIRAFREEKLPNADKFNGIAKVLAKLDDDERNSAYLDIVDFIRDSIDEGVKEKFKVQTPKTSSKSSKEEENELAVKYAKRDSSSESRNSNFSAWNK